MLPGSSQDTDKLTVGIALLPSKAKKHLKGSLLARAANAGIQIKVVDPDQPLEEQGPFDVVLHKVNRNKAWRGAFIQFQKRHPEVRVLDAFDAIKTLQCRETMLQPFDEGPIIVQDPSATEQTAPGSSLRCCAPVQIALHEGCTADMAVAAVDAAGMQVPLVGKPLWADGREGSHGLAIVHDEGAIRRLVSPARPGVPASPFGPPLMLQQYIDHGGCLFKVYVMGPIVVMARRPSLQIPVAEGDLTDGGLDGSLQSVARVSAFHSGTPSPSTSWGDPPHWLVEGLAQELRHRLHLHLFNFDLIRPRRHPVHGAQHRTSDYLVIDINYFPGYEKLPGYESMMVDFLQTLAADSRKPHDATFACPSHLKHAVSQTPSWSRRDESYKGQQKDDVGGHGCGS
ncbi:hypothetical protein WJX84_009842 [Apatococcus fuscideae]|uniref:Inositol-tetrakisphosphate 1-kinase n=1 Tax=Apatococcus fuscideae TaxID=2026836 RepID=A0AAW1TH98_9CHLO